MIVDLVDSKCNLVTEFDAMKKKTSNSVFDSRRALADNYILLYIYYDYMYIL